MNVYIGLCICLAALTKAEELTVETNDMNDFDASVLDIEKEGSNYIIDVRQPLSEDSVILELRYQNEGDGRRFTRKNANLCDNDTSTQIGTFATIIRSSMGIDCPVEVGTYTRPDKFQSDGEVGSNGGTKMSLRVIAYESVDGQANHNKPLFSATYTITPNGN